MRYVSSDVGGVRIDRDRFTGIEKILCMLGITRRERGHSLSGHQSQVHSTAACPFRDTCPREHSGLIVTCWILSFFAFDALPIDPLRLTIISYSLL